VEEVLTFFAGTYRRSQRESSDIVAVVGLGPALLGHGEGALCEDPYRRTYRWPGQLIYCASP
jgi:hypothetical protein